MQFLLTPHTFRILVGRGLNLICKKCRMAINVKVECTCIVCKHVTDVVGKWNDDLYELETKCERCNSSACKIIYTQMVESKHRKGNHCYYHSKCWDEMFFDA